VSFYEIRVKEHLDERWSDWFDGLEITNLENGETVLSGEIVDQAALHGVLAKVRDLNLALVAVSRVDRERKTQLSDRHRTDQVGFTEVIGLDPRRPSRRSSNL